MTATRSFLLFLVLLHSSLSSLSAAEKDVSIECPCTILNKPGLEHKEETARWMVHSLDWGILSTISTRLLKTDGGLIETRGTATTTASLPVPFGNVYSFADGTCNNSTGTPYFYGTFMDQSFLDAKENTAVSLSLSEASLSSVCGAEALPSCAIVSGAYGDPENPVCARLVLSGVLVLLKEDDEEYHFAKRSLFQRHGSMEDWPQDHNWVVAKVDVQDIWLIDYFGGASILNVETYKSLDLTSMQDME